MTDCNIICLSYFDMSKINLIRFLNAASIKRRNKALIKTARLWYVVYEGWLHMEWNDQYYGEN